MIKWLISQQVRAVNTSSKTTKETDRERGKELKKDQRDDSQEEKSRIKTSKMESDESLERTFCAQIGVLGMSDSLTNTTACAIMRRCQ